MKKEFILLLVFLILATSLFSAGCLQNQSGTLPATPVNTPAIQPVKYTSNETLVAFVNRAAAYAREQGTTKALAEFNNRNGTFFEGELYIYAYGFNGTTLAHPVNPESIGKLREGELGVFVREMGHVVRNGSGYYRFTYINPQHNGTLESKLGYGVQVSDDWWLGSGVYNGPVNPESRAI
jgi:signal transduction histidine kinase